MGDVITCDGSIGKAVPSRTNPALVAGAATFVADVTAPGTLHLRFLRSPHARARIVSIDVTAAAKLPRVHHVVTGTDVCDEIPAIPLLIEPLAVGIPAAVVPLLAVDTVRYAGEPVVAVLADDAESAAGALGAIHIVWDVLPPVLDRDEAMRDGAPLVEPIWTSNVMFRQHLESGACAGAFEAAAGTVRGELAMGRITASPMETPGMLASWDAIVGRLTCWAATQNPHVLRAYIATALGLTTHDVRVIQPSVGGAFGAKLPLRPEEILVCYLARRFRRPVKWIEERQDYLVACGHSRDTRCRYEAAYAADGKITALKAELVSDLGAAAALSGFLMAMNTFMCMPGPYKIENLDLDLIGVVTNKAPWQAYRGFGKEAASFFLDRIVDHVGAASGVGSVAVRFKNFIPASEMPYPQPSGPITDSGDFAACLTKLLEMIDEPAFRRQQAEARHNGRYIGLGFGQELTPEGAAPPASLFGGYDAAHVRMSSSGDVTVLTGVTSPGTGNETGIAQIVADSLGCRLDRVRVIAGDTDACPQGSGNYSSRSLTVGGQAAHLAALDIRHKLIAVGASMIEANPADIRIADGMLSVAGSTEPAMPIDRVAAEVYLNTHGANMDGIEPGLEAVRYSKMDNIYHQPMKQGRFSMYPNWSNASAAAIVEVDPDTAKTSVLRYLLVHDSGKIVNPLLANAQLQGAVMQGIGAALYEFAVYDEAGTPLSDSFMQYTLPSSMEAVVVELAHCESLSPFTHLGVKGVGESGISAPSGAIAAAIEDALSLPAATLIAPPFTPSRVWSALHQAAVAQ